MKGLRRIQYNSPVILTFALISLVVLALDWFTGGLSTSRLFSVYRCSLLDPLAYLRFFGHVLGHSGLDHYMGNILLMLVVGPPLEEKYGSRTLLLAMVITAAVSGVVQFAFFPGTALLGASGEVFMLIVLSSLGGAKEGRIPLTLIFVVVFYLGNELLTGLLARDNISQLTHIVGGACGAVIGFLVINHKLKRR